MNYTDKLRDVMTLPTSWATACTVSIAPVGYLQCDTPLTTAEMASVFGEMLTFRRLKELFPSRARDWPCSAARSRTPSPLSSDRSC